MEYEIDPASLLEVSLVEENEEPAFEIADEVSESVQVEVDPLAFGDCPVGDDTPAVGPFSGNLELAIFSQQLENQASNLSEVEPKEQIYRQQIYQTLNIVLKKRLHCTICDIHIGCSLSVLDPRVIHPLLKVVICISCSEIYNIAWSEPGPDGSNICRWCGSNGRFIDPSSPDSGLRFCSSCPYAFCERCIYRNFPFDEPGNPTWICFVCNLVELWPHRALCWALVSLLNNLASRKIKDPIWSSDISECCRKAKQRMLEGNYKLAAVKFRKLNDIQPPKSNVTTHKIIPRRNRSLTGRGTKPITNGISHKSASVDTVWLKSKMKCISTNMAVISQKLTCINGSLSELDSEAKVSSTMESVNSLLELARKQLEEYSVDLKKDWDSRNFVRYPNRNSPVNNVTKEKNGCIKPSRVVNKIKIPIKQVSIKRLNIRPKTTPQLGLERCQTKPTSDDLFRIYNLKQCYIKLERCLVSE